MNVTNIVNITNAAYGDTVQLRVIRHSDNKVYDFQGAVKGFKPKTGEGAPADVAHTLTDAATVDAFGEFTIELPDAVVRETCRIHVISDGEIKRALIKGKGGVQCYDANIMPLVNWTNARVSNR